MVWMKTKGDNLLHVIVPLYLVCITSDMYFEFKVQKLKTIFFHVYIYIYHTYYVASLSTSGFMMNKY